MSKRTQLIETDKPQAGGRATLQTAEGLAVEVHILNVRPVFGRYDCEVTPVAGEGRATVQSRRMSNCRIAQQAADGGSKTDAA